MGVIHPLPKGFADMPINEALFAAMKAASFVKPNARKSYRLQRMAEELIARAAPANPKCRVDDATAAMPDGHALPLRVFTPVAPYGAPPPKTQTEDGSDVPIPTPRGTILFFHGGGWVTGGINLYTQACAHMAVRLQRRVISVEYRLAPEYRFPTAAEDCYEAARQLFAGELDLPATPAGEGSPDPNDIVLFGDSAGGNLAAAVSLMARDRGEFMPRTQMLLYPVVGNDYNPDTSPFESVRSNGTDYILTAQDMADYVDMYRSSVQDLTNPYFAPITAHNLSGQPRTLVLSAEYCPLRDEDEAYARRLQLVNGDHAVSCYRVSNGVHGYLLNTSAVELVATTYRLIEHFLDGTPLAAPAAGAAGGTAGAADTTMAAASTVSTASTASTASSADGAPRTTEGGAAWRDVLGTD